MPRRSPEPRTDALLTEVRRKLAAAADAKRAPAMRAYMKSAMPYHGVPAPAVRAVCKELFAPLAFSTRAAWEHEVRAMWDGARFREERYAAIALSGVRAARGFQTPESLSLYEHMIVTGAWWDVVDDVATHRVGPILRAHPKPTRALMLRWAKDQDMWKARAAIICQARSGERTDLELLYACIEPSIGSKEFFLRKAIGWALREYARRDPREIARWVKAHEARLSGLSKREALKHV